MRFGLLIFFSIMILGCYNVSRDCRNFKTGIFKSEITIGDTYYMSNFIRVDTLQIEFFEGKTDSASVRWINDCEVIFHTINPRKMADRKDIHLKILTTTDSSYTFEYSYVGETKKQRGVATKTN